jgi:rhodanese-related sulfurtransferase
MTIKHLTVQQAHQQQSAGAAYLDVRSIPEFQQGHPEGAFNIPLLHMDPGSGQMRPNPEFIDVVRRTFAPETNLVVGCKMGGRSAQACELLAGAGYSNVSNVLGGYGGAPQQGHIGWSQAGLPIETAADPALSIGGSGVSPPPPPIARRGPSNGGSTGSTISGCPPATRATRCRRGARPPSPTARRSTASRRPTTTR